MTRRLVLVLAVIGCGGSSEPEPQAAAAWSIVQPASSADDVVVATVNGRPVWGSCVAAQGKPPKVGLDDCIAFELMAQRAEAKGLGSDPNVLDAARTAMVSRVIATEFEDKVKTEADLHGAYDDEIQKRLYLMHQPELRASAYLRVPVAENAPAAEDEAAHALAQQLADPLRDETGLFAVTIDEVADRIAQGRKVEHQVVPARARDQLNKVYGDALFGIPDVGRIAGPVRTKWGWDVILWTEGWPPRERTRDEIVAEMFPELRRKYFLRWSVGVQRELGVKVEVDVSQMGDD